jgi:hypothetical protein
MMQQLFLETQNLFSETLPDYLLDELKLIPKKAALFLQLDFKRLFFFLVIFTHVQLLFARV